MGWANCGEDSEGRSIGYAHGATCDAPGCDEPIHRGLAHACGGEHGETETGCEKYFCGRHMICVEFRDGEVASVCMACANNFEMDGCLADDY